MSEVAPKYYCLSCRRYLFGETSTSLAVRLNIHNNEMHPSVFANWTGESILQSACYEGPIHITLPPVVAGDGGTGQSKEIPQITDEDRLFLATGRVKWD
jgi:hypothetical protein